MGADQKRAVLAVIISGVILFGWQYFFAPAPAPVSKTDVVATEAPTKDVNTEKQNNSLNVETKNDVEVNNNTKVETFTIENELNSYTFDNYLTVTNAIFKKSTSDFKKVFKESGNNSLYINTTGKFSKVYFNITEDTDTSLKVQSNDGSITGSVFIDEKGYLNVNLLSTSPFTYKFEFIEREEELSGGKEKLFTLLSDDLDTTSVGSDDKGDKEVKWFGADFDYHMFATVVGKKPMVYKITEEGNYTVKDLKATNSLTYKQIFVKKEYDTLANLGENMELAVDFGIWSILAVPILRGLQFFFTIFPNYGISIIILTLLMRTLTFPLQYKSFKSMKKMQDIQPELTKIREKFKSDPQKMQQETMSLFKKAGANPLGGCLPLILQMPIFFAFYRVLYSSVELVDAPFYFWITDLSQKDPYYVLPVLMALAMFFHQKLTPSTTADPTQKKLMMFMPLIFAVFMKDFPAGLTLYIFVSTMVAMLQQMFVFKRA